MRLRAGEGIDCSGVDAGGGGMAAAEEVDMTDPRLQRCGFAKLEVCCACCQTVADTSTVCYFVLIHHGDEAASRFWEPGIAIWLRAPAASRSRTSILHHATSMPRPAAATVKVITYLSST